MLFNAALIIYNSIGEYETRPDAALGLCSGLELWLGVESNAVARPSPIRLPVPVSDQIWPGRVLMASVIMMRARRFHTSPTAGRGMSGCQ